MTGVGSVVVADFFGGSFRAESGRLFFAHTLSTDTAASAVLAGG